MALDDYIFHYLNVSYLMLEKFRLFPLHACVVPHICSQCMHEPSKYMYTPMCAYMHPSEDHSHSGKL